jgi:hypothetical protein
LRAKWRILYSVLAREKAVESEAAIRYVALELLQMPVTSNISIVKK